MVFRGREYEKITFPINPAGEFRTVLDSMDDLDSMDSSTTPANRIPSFSLEIEVRWKGRSDFLHTMGGEVNPDPSVPFERMVASFTSSRA